jgi:DNA phosphorothioation-dependent restriction protein DptG
VEDCNSGIKKTTREPFFFSVAWESLSKGRQAYQAGWKRIDGKLFSMWAHANFLEMLNYLPVEGVERPFGYDELFNWSKNASIAEKQQLLSSLDALIEFYREGVASLGFNWSRFELDGSLYVEIEEKVRLFYKMVEFQFLDSTRKGAADRYSKWLRQFASVNYLKARGPLGNTLCFTREQLLFLTRICIGDRSDGKLRVTDLWVEFENRGVCFDSDTKKHILDLYNKLNLIEKKSDSGDAQYVRAIF